MDVKYLNGFYYFQVRFNDNKHKGIYRLSEEGGKIEKFVDNFSGPFGKVIQVNPLSPDFLVVNSESQSFKVVNIEKRDYFEISGTNGCYLLWHAELYKQVNKYVNSN